MRAGWPDSAGKHRPSGTPPSSQGAGSDGGTSSTANSVPRSCFPHERCTRSTTSSTTSPSNFSARVRLAGAVGGEERTSDAASPAVAPSWHRSVAARPGGAQQDQELVEQRPGEG